MKDDDNKAVKERRKRNIVLAVVLGSVAILFYLMSVVQWREHFG